MIRNALFLALGAAGLLMLAERTSAQPGRQPAGKAGQMEWGGVRMEKASLEMQTDLGLGETEGLVVLSVAANSVGEQVGLKVNDVLVKFGDKSVPNDATSFGMLVKEHKAEEPIDLVVVRDGKEETLKGAKMPALVQNLTGKGGGFGGRGRGGVLIFPPFKINPRVPNDPMQPGTIQNMRVEMNVNGAKIFRKQTNDQFFGEYSKDDLKITVTGKVENGQVKPAEITVTEGKETKKYTSLRDVPAHHRALVQQLMPSSTSNLMRMPVNPTLQDLQDRLLELPK
jgi:membrane-associated protease RseP (regulator of RpoE activity)